MKLLFPQRLFLEITTECNLNCILCRLWQRKDPPDKLKIEHKIEFLDNLILWLESVDSNFKKNLSVILTGGEPFLHPNQVFEIAEFCKNEEIECNVNSNGVLLYPLIDKTLNSGLSALTISIDSHISEIHNDLRNSPGLFDYLKEIIIRIVQTKRENGYPIKICIQSILGKWNINNLYDHIQFFESLGIDGITFQPLQYPFGLLIPQQWYEKFDKFPSSIEDIQNAVSDLLKLKNSDGFIMNSKEEIEIWLEYFKNPEYLPENKNQCRAYEQNLIVDVCGNVKFCFNKMIEPLNKIGNILTTPITEIWNGRIATKIREEMRVCKRACGVMACHINTELRKK